jgi:carboxyl-terminal processing protease
VERIIPVENQVFAIVLTFLIFVQTLSRFCLFCGGVFASLLTKFFVSTGYKFNLSTYLPLIIGGTLAFGIILGGQFSNSKLDGKDEVLNQTLKLREILWYINNEYVDSVQTSSLVDETIGKLLENLDPHSNYLTPQRAEIANASLLGGFDGIGVEFNMLRDTLFVVGVVPDGPSYKAGLMPGDRIVVVDNDTIAGRRLSNEVIIQKLRGPKGSSVFVQVNRRSEKELLGFTIKRAAIATSTVDTYYLGADDIGFIKLSSFGSKSADEFKSALSDLVSKGMRGLILDLRGNGGGYVSAAEQIADELLGNNALIVTQKGKQDKYLKETRAIRPGMFEEGPVVVLMDEFSASASEILAGALQDNDRALIVGRRSYGKGLVQRPFKLNDNSELRLTVARYYTPSGRSIQRSYENGREEYQKDINQRFQSGEMYDWHLQGLDTSNVFSTLSGRPVYGGGGISPDVFIPIDTTGQKPFANQVLNAQLLREMAIEYLEEHKLKLMAYEVQDAVKQFSHTESDWTKILARAKSLGIEAPETIPAATKSELMQYYKAYIFRGAFGDEGFFAVLNINDPMYLRALQEIDRAALLAGK